MSFRQPEEGEHEGDDLKLMWDQQEAFMKLLQEKRGFIPFPVDMETKEAQVAISNVMHHTMSELFEAGLHLKNSKRHRATEIKGFDSEGYTEELCDVLHLFFEICIMSGITKEQLVEMYLRKGETNTARINGGY